MRGALVFLVCSEVAYLSVHRVRAATDGSSGHTGVSDRAATRGSPLGVGQSLVVVSALSRPRARARTPTRGATAAALSALSQLSPHSTCAVQVNEVQVLVSRPLSPARLVRSTFTHFHVSALSGFSSLEIRTRNLRPPLLWVQGSLRSHSLGTAPGLCPVSPPRECASYAAFQHFQHYLSARLISRWVQHQVNLSTVRGKLAV